MNEWTTDQWTSRSTRWPEWTVSEIKTDRPRGTCHLKKLSSKYSRKIKMPLDENPASLGAKHSEKSRSRVLHLTDMYNNICHIQKRINKRKPVAEENIAKNRTGEKTNQDPISMAYCFPIEHGLMTKFSWPWISAVVPSSEVASPSWTLSKKSLIVAWLRDMMR